MSEYLETLGALIHYHRKARKMTMRALGYAVGVSAAAVADWEHGRRVPVSARVAPLADALGLEGTAFAQRVEAERRGPEGSRDKRKMARPGRTKNRRPYPQEDADEQTGWRIREARDRAGIAQWRVAKAIGVTQAQLSAWERGYTPCPVHRLADIAELTGEPLAYFTGEEVER